MPKNLEFVQSLSSKVITSDRFLAVPSCIMNLLFEPTLRGGEQPTPWPTSSSGVFKFAEMPTKKCDNETAGGVGKMWAGTEEYLTPIILMR
jgi:hypothetical protein